MEVIHIRWARSGRVDRDGNEIEEAIETPRTAHVFAPKVDAEIHGTEAVIAGYGGTLYFRAPHLFAALPKDQFVIRGELFDVDGPGAYWETKNGKAVGVAVVVKRAEASNE